MKISKIVVLVTALFFININYVAADVFSSSSVMQTENTHFQKQQILTMLDTTEVQQKLVALGVSQSDAAFRISNMTPEEVQSLNTQLHEAPAGGVIGTIVTVLVVIAVLDVLGITDVYSFIRPIN